MLLWMFLCNEGGSCANTFVAKKHYNGHPSRAPAGAWRSCECQWKARFRGGETEKIMTPMTKYRRRQSTRNRDGIVRRLEMG